MKKGNLEIKEDMDDSFVFRANNYSVYRIGNMQDLKDLRSLIDTVLKEERKIGGHTYSKSGKDMCCQPLTEGEKCECKEMSCKDGCDRKHTCKTFWCEKCKPQESNKEGEPLQKAFTRGNSCLSKKPSMTIGCMECGNNIKI